MKERVLIFLSIFPNWEIMYFVNHRIPCYDCDVLNGKVRELLLFLIDVNNLSAGGFTSVGGQIGVGIEGSPASVINVQATYQYTPVVKPIFQLK